ncbi:MAG: hypothetical protein ABI811_16795 [Acidobacteriota bacterium]
MATYSDPQRLQEEYDMYVSMWNDAKQVDGPDAPITAFARSLVDQVAEELKALRNPIAA